MTNMKKTNNITTPTLLRMVLLLLLMVGANGAWGQATTVIANIDFSNRIVNQVADGTVNSMTIGANNNNPTTVNEDGRLVLGNTTNVVTIPENQRDGSLVTVSFDLAFGKLLNRNVFFRLKDANGNVIGSLKFNPYANVLNTDLGIEKEDMYYGNNTVLWDRKVTFTITLDYSTNKITTATSCTSATNTSANHEVTMTYTNPLATFEIGSTYDNAERYCQFDNLTILSNTNYYSYKLKSSLGTVIATGTAVSGTQLVLPYPEFELSGTVLYKADTNSSSDYYRKTYTLNNAAGLCETITYNTKEAENVVFYTEAEDIVGANTSDVGKVRCSNGLGANFSSQTLLTTLYPGKYYIWGQIGGNTNPSVTYNVTANNSSVWSLSTTGSLTSTPSEQITLDTQTPLYVEAENTGNRYIDCFYIQGQAISFPVNSGTMSQLSTQVVTVYNASASTAYSSSNESIATVASNGDGTITITTYSTNGTATIKATENGSYATYTVTVEQGTLAFAENARTAYIEDLKYQYEATSSSTTPITYSVPGGNGVAYIDNASTGALRLVKPGTVVVTATDARGLSTTYTLTVGTRQSLSANTLTTGQTFDVGTQVGQLTDESITIGGATLYFGASTTNNGREEVQVVRSIRGGYGLTCPDVNGYTFGNITNFTAGHNDQWGTYYRLDTGSEVNTIIITGYFSDDVTNLYLYDTTGKKLMTLLNTGADLASVVMDGTLLQPNTTYYLYAPHESGWGLFALKSFTHTNVKAELDYADSFEGVAFCGDALTAPTLTIKDAGGNDISSHYTRGSFTSSKPSIATVDGNTGALTARSSVGRTIISLSLTSDDPATYPHLVVTDTIDVTDGVWEFTQYDRNHGQYYMYGSPGWNFDWNDSKALRDNQNYEFVLMNQEFTARKPDWISYQYGEPLPLATGLRTRYKLRFMSSTASGDLGARRGGQLHLFGAGVGDNRAKWGHGGEIMIPAKKDMLIEINCWADDAASEMTIEGATELDGTDVQNFYVNNGAAQTFQFLAKDDGFVYVKNSSTNLDLHINYIKATSNMAFEYGYETYTDPTINNKFTNAVLNQGTTTLSYTFENLDDADMCEGISSTGEATLRSGSYGSYQVTVSGSGEGILAGQTATYTVHSIGFTFTPPASELVSTTGVRTYSSSELKDLLSISTNALKDKVEFSVVSTSPVTTIATTEGAVGNQTLTIEGSGSVVVRATLGAITRDVTFLITGADLNDRAPTILNDTEDGTYTVTIVGDASNITYISYDTIAMKDGIRGTLDPEAITFTGSTDSEGKASLIIGGLNQGRNGNPDKGGTIPIYATCDYKGIGTVHLTGVLTVAYQKHTWNFQQNLIPTLGNWYATTNPKTKEGLWTANATFDEPVDATTNHSDTHDWRFVRKIGGHTDVSIVYYYNHSSEGQNSFIIPETSGLHIHSTKAEKQLGVEMATDDSHNAITTGDKYSASNLMLLRGGKLIIPKVKPGQWIEMRWTRHKEDMAERIIMKNLCDFDGKYIDQIYKIGNCYYNLPWSTSTYMFRVAGPEDDASVVLDEDGCVDAVFEIADNIYISIQQIELHEPGWDFTPSIESTLKGYVDTPTPSFDSKDNAPLVNWQYIWNQEAPHTITLLSKQYQNAPNAPQTWTFEKDDMLDMITSGFDNDQATLTYNGGWGKVKVTMTSYSQNMKYVANKRSWTITFGKAPAQTYPYTWDFTKYRSATRANLGDVTWTYNGDEVTVKTDNYYTNDYESYFVDNSQLMSKALNSALPETEGLGFSITDKTNGGMTLDMQSKVASTGSTASDGKTWKSGELSFKGGGTITVPAPGTDGYYIYIKSSVEPTSVSNTTTCDRTDVNNSNGQYCYKIDNKDTDAVITFNSDADIYAIGVTNIFKDLTPMSGTAWATESRDHAIDHSLTGYLTTNPVKAYAIIETEENPSYTTDLKKATVAIKDQRYVVPANTGLVLKQTESLPTLGEGVTTYNVPLFYPAVTTSTTSEDFTNNLMRPNITAATYSSEQEGFNNNTYVRFILASRYMTWMQTEAAGVTTKTYPSEWEKGSQPVFYKLHIYKSRIAGEDVATLNTLGANKAYLLLPYKQGMNYPLWWGDSSSPAPRRYIAIEGVSDMEELEALEEMEREAGRGDGRIYNLNGQAVGNDEKSLPAGIYVKNGKKFMVK